MSEPLSDRSQLSNVLRTVEIHQHLCVIYETREQQLAVTVPFLKIGLERGEKCLYVADENTATSILDAMRGEGVDIDEPVKKGMLAVVNKGREYLRKGYFDPDEMIHYLAGNVRVAKGAGYPAFRFAGEMTWALSGDPGVDRLMEYETRLNQFLSEHDALCVCQYNNKRFAPETILQILRTHPLVIYGGHVCKNPYFVPPDEFLKPNQPEAEVQRLLNNIQKYEMVERALRNARDEWEQSFNAISDFVCILDTSGAILRTNKSMLERFEPIHGNLAGLTFHEVFWGRGRRDPVAPWEITLSEGIPVSFETKLPTSDGWYTVSSYPLNDDRHQRWGAIFIVRDITKRKRAEEALRSSERQQRRIASQLERERARLIEAQEVAKVGSWEAELQSLDVIWSEQTHRIFETEPSLFHPTRPKFREFIHPEDRAKVDAALVASLDKRTPCAVEYRIVMPDGRVKILEDRWRVFQDLEGKPIRVAGTCRDVTERVRAEEELQRLSGTLLRMQDEERQRIARDLHDSTGQDLVALATMLGQLRSSIPSADQTSKDRLAECNALVDACIRDVRTLSYMLHSPVLDQAGLGDAIREYVDGFTKRSGIRVELELSPHLGRIARDVELALFRVVQEALTNIHRHSGSQKAKIRIDRGSSLVLEISDGERAALGNTLRSEDVLKFKAGVGILSMQERVKSIEGRLEIDSTAHGTTVRVTMPLGGEEREKTADSDR